MSNFILGIGRKTLHKAKHQRENGVESKDDLQTVAIFFNESTRIEQYHYSSTLYCRREAIWAREINERRSSFRHPFWRNSCCDGQDCMYVSQSGLKLTCANSFADAEAVSERKPAMVGDQRCNSSALIVPQRLLRFSISCIMTSPKACESG